MSYCSRETQDRLVGTKLAALALRASDCIRCGRLVRVSYRTNLAALLVVVGTATLVVTKLNGSIVPNLATGARVTTSSREPNTPDPSCFVDGDIFGLGFHTRSESRPWVMIDLGREKQIHRLVLYNRVDCCRSRAIPLAVEVGHSDHDFRELTRIDEGFEIWEWEFAKMPVRFIRIESQAADYLSLNEIEVR